MTLVLDFDGTIAVNDTIGELASYAIAIQQLRGRGDLAPAWQHIIEAYERDYKEYSLSYRPSEQNRTRVEQEVAFLRGLVDLDAASRRRVENARLFEDICAEDLKGCYLRGEGKRGVRIRDGFAEFVARVREMGVRIVVVSVNWSREFVGCILGDVCPDGRWEVVANSIEGEGGRILGPRGVVVGDGVMATSGDKVKAVEVALGIGGGEGEGVGWKDVVYIGDSLTDFECLVSCGQGVVMIGDGGSTLLRTLERVGRTVLHVKMGDGERIGWASDFNEVLEGGLLERLSQRRDCGGGDARDGESCPHFGDDSGVDGLEFW